MDCGYRGHPAALDFDHVRGEKTMAVSLMAERYASWAKVLEEIEKCVVRCANCHRIKTWAKGE